MATLSINLGSDENLLYIAKKHWFTLFWPLVFTFISCGIFIPWAIIAFLRFLWDEIIITDQKVYIKTGVISKSTVTTPLDKINNIHINKGILGRILNYGTVIIQSGAMLGTSGYSCIKSPEEVQQYIEQATN